MDKMNFKNKDEIKAYEYLKGLYPEDTYEISYEEYSFKIKRNNPYPEQSEFFRYTPDFVVKQLGWPQHTDIMTREALEEYGEPKIIAIYEVKGHWEARKVFLTKWADINKHFKTAYIEYYVGKMVKGKWEPLSISKKKGKK